MTARAKPIRRAEFIADLSEDWPDWLDLDGYCYKGRKKTSQESYDPKTKTTTVRSEWEVYVELTRLSSRCIFCGEERCLHILRTNLQGIRDQPIRGIPCMLRVDRPYYLCMACKQHWSELLPHLDPNRDMTDRLRNHVWDESFRKTNSLIDTEANIDEKTIRDIQKDGFEALDKSRKIELPEHIYFDDINLSPKKRYSGIDLTISIKRRMRAVCGDGVRGRPIEIFDKCDDTLVARFFSQFTPEQLAGVKYVSMDLSKFFDRVIKTCLPGVPRIADHYHVKKLINDHFDDDFRKPLGNKIVSEAQAAGAARGVTDPAELERIEVAAKKEASKLAAHRFSMLKRPGNRLDQEKMDIEAFCLTDSVLKHGLAEKDALFALWDEAEDSQPKRRKYKLQSAEEARRAYIAWMRDLTEKTRPHWQGLINSVEAWSTEIFLFFDLPITNSPAETGNGIIRSQNQRGRDYGFPVIRGKALYRDVRGEDVPWEGEDKSEPTAASEARTFKAARARKEQAEKRHLQNSKVPLGEAGPLLLPPAAPVLQLAASEPISNSSPACMSCDSGRPKPSVEDRADPNHLGEQPENTRELEDPKPAENMLTGLRASTGFDVLGNRENSRLCSNDIDCMFVRLGGPCAWCHHIPSQSEATP